MPDTGADYVKKKVLDEKKLEDEFQSIEGAIGELRAAYEQYFLGVERHMPTDRHTALKRRLNELKGSFVRQTALRFRIGTLYQKFVTYERLWQRTLQEIENGTYSRDVFKARRRAEKLKAPPPAKAAAKASDDFDVDEDAPPPPPPAAAARVPAPAAAASRPAPVNGAAMSDEKVRAIYDAYVTAKKRCNEDVSRLDYATVAATLRKQVPELMKQHQAKSIEFKIVIKDGKAVLKALPKT